MEEALVGARYYNKLFMNLCEFARAIWFRMFFFFQYVNEVFIQLKNYTYFEVEKIIGEIAFS